jgi:hypothetical protein
LIATWMEAMVHLKGLSMNLQSVTAQIGRHAPL